ncbi:MAG: UDP-N-acetylmuramate--alanine ligase [Elusimicrobia bacterium]|nr:UDP-N-acetylmuramate--alanine ligase [Elusimicrobiota bacterium]
MEGNVHFVGVAGTGMSALAQMSAFKGERVSGSDRLSESREFSDSRTRLERLGVKIFPQDGSGIDASTRRVVASTAIESDNRDLARARELGIPVVHRADELAALAAGYRTVAVGGTSGKSTVTAMIFHILETAGRSPSLVSGANLISLRRRGWLGNACKGNSDLLVIEADESDGTLTRYRPFLGVLLNLSKDHKEPAELEKLFGLFKERSGRFTVNADAAGLSRFQDGGPSFGFESGRLRGADLELGAGFCRFRVDGVRFELPLSGRHNADNALAAAAACLELELPLADSARALSSYEGVSRRFERLGVGRGVEVIDDFAHNPDKVKAAIAAARLRCRRILAVFQLHGFSPARFLRPELTQAFAESLAPEDILWLPEIYYAGGTAAKDISARDYAESLQALGKDARFSPQREDIVAEVAAEARSGDLVLVMGARDPSLSAFARRILEGLASPAQMRPKSS